MKTGINQYTQDKKYHNRFLQLIAFIGFVGTVFIWDYVRSITHSAVSANIIAGMYAFAMFGTMFVCHWLLCQQQKQLCRIETKDPSDASIDDLMPDTWPSLSHTQAPPRYTEFQGVMLEDWTTPKADAEATPPQSSKVVDIHTRR